MRGIIKRIAALVIIVLSLVSTIGCDTIKSWGQPKYTATSGFFYSADKGHTYGDGTKRSI